MRKKNNYGKIIDFLLVFVFGILVVISTVSLIVWAYNSNYTSTTIGGQEIEGYWCSWNGYDSPLICYRYDDTKYEVINYKKQFKENK